MEIEKLTPQLMREFGEAIWGKTAQPTAVFTTGRRLDVVASQEAGRRIEHVIPYIALKFPGNTDCISKPATQADIQKYPAEFAKYQEEIRRGNQECYQGWQDVGGSQPGQEHRNLEGQGASDTVADFRAARLIG